MCQPSQEINSFDQKEYSLGLGCVLRSEELSCSMRVFILADPPIFADPAKLELRLGWLTSPVIKPESSSNFQEKVWYVSKVLRRMSGPFLDLYFHSSPAFSTGRIRLANLPAVV